MVKMCNEAIYFIYVIGVYSWLVCDKRGVGMWYDGDDYYDEDNFFKWYEGYKKVKD